MKALLAPALALLALSAAACGPLESAPAEDSPAVDGAALTGLGGAERAIHFQGYVYVAAGSADSVIQSAIARQVRTAIGALRALRVSLNDRGARNALDPARWTRSTLTVADPAGARPVLRVVYRYDDRAVVDRALDRRSTIDFAMLADDYGLHAAPLVSDCSDDKTTDAGSLWYHFSPQQAPCRARIAAEAQAITAEARALGATVDRVGPKEAGRWFLPATAKLDPVALPKLRFSPEYDRLYGAGGSKDTVVAYVFLGVDGYRPESAYAPDDLLGVEAAKFHRALLRAQPSFRATFTKPFAMLLDFTLDGRSLPGVTYDQMLGWIIDKAGYPAGATEPAQQADLRRQAMAKLAERWIYWELPLRVTTARGETKTVRLQVRTYYGLEDGTPEARQQAQWRYLEAFWHADVFVYNGHSHFGNGPLEPTLYGAQNFDAHYQVMFVNSCLSFNYYHEDFLRMKPGGSRNLDMVVNGLPSFVQDSGVVAARFVTTLFDGTQKAWADVLGAMRLNVAGQSGYEPLRVVDGELDNVFSQAATPLRVEVLPPVD